MTKNTLGDMHNLLMEQMERLADADAEQVDKEVKRANAMAGMATAINNNAVTILKVANVRARSGTDLPKMLTGSEDA